MTTYCCPQFAREAGHLRPMAGGGLLYPASVRPRGGQIEANDEGTWDVLGCCGGGCCVLEKMKFCPWCGTSVSQFRAEETTS